MEPPHTHELAHTNIWLVGRAYCVGGLQEACCLEVAFAPLLVQAGDTRVNTQAAFVVLLQALTPQISSAERKGVVARHHPQLDSPRCSLAERPLSPIRLQGFSKAQADDAIASL